MAIRTPWNIVKKKLWCFIVGHPEAIPVGVLSRRGGFHGLDMFQCPRCQEMWARGTGKKLIGGKNVGNVS